MTEKKSIKVLGNYIIEKEGENVKAIIAPWGRRIEVGQRVISSGRIVAKGMGGIVIKLYIPFQGYRTSDVIKVLFDGENFPRSVKFKDII